MKSLKKLLRRLMSNKPFLSVEKVLEFCVLMFACVICPLQVTAQNRNDSARPFVRYKNDNTIGMRLDQAVITDKYFELQIPEGLQNRRLIGSTAFKQILQFKNGEKIVLLYIPNADSTVNRQSLCLSYKEFIQLCESENIMDYLDGIDFKQRGYFGVNRVENGLFYAIYLNVRRRQLKAFEYSIGSIVFPKL